MNAGCYGREIKDVFVEATAIDGRGATHRLVAADMAFVYRKSGVPDDFVFVEAVFEGGATDAPDAIRARMAALVEQREASQPVKTRTGGSTFKNPRGHKAWQLIDEAGCRELMQRSGTGFREALQLPDQHGRRLGRRHRSARRRGAGASEGEIRYRTRMGDQTGGRPMNIADGSMAFSARRARWLRGGRWTFAPIDLSRSNLNADRRALCANQFLGEVDVEGGYARGVQRYPRNHSVLSAKNAHAPESPAS